MGTTRLRARLFGLLVLVALLGIAFVARPHPQEPTPAEQATMDRVDAAVADREMQGHPEPTMHPANVTDAAACLQRAGFRIVRRTGNSLAVERQDVPRAAIRFYPPGPAAVSNLPESAPGATARWTATNNVRIREPNSWYLHTTPDARRQFFHCLNAA